jgi:hypothetical protein
MGAADPGILGLSEAFFLFLPAPKNPAMAHKLGQIESVLSLPSAPQANDVYPHRHGHGSDAPVLVA